MRPTTARPPDAGRDANNATTDIGRVMEPEHERDAAGERQRNEKKAVSGKAATAAR